MERKVQLDVPSSTVNSVVVAHDFQELADFKNLNRCFQFAFEGTD